jgi:hypothetical protein
MFTKIAIVVEQHIRPAECLLLSEALDPSRFACHQNRFDKPHRSAGATQAAPLGELRRLLMESHHDGNATKCLFIRSCLFIPSVIREAFRSVRTAGPKDLTVTVGTAGNPSMHTPEISIVFIEPDGVDGINTMGSA